MGADLVVTALPTGFRHRRGAARTSEDATGTAASAVEGTDGLTLTEDKGGRLLLKRARTKKTRRLGATADHVGRQCPGPLSALANALKITTEVVTGGPAGPELVLKPDHAFLTDPATTYPVTRGPDGHPAGQQLTSTPARSTSTPLSTPPAPTALYLLAGTMPGGFRRGRTCSSTRPASAGAARWTDARLAMNTIDAQNCGTVVGSGIQVARLTATWNPGQPAAGATSPPSTTEDAPTILQRRHRRLRSAFSGPLRLERSPASPRTGRPEAANHGLVLKLAQRGQHDNELPGVHSPAEDTVTPSPSSRRRTLTVTTGLPRRRSSPALATTPAQVVNGATTHRPRSPRTCRSPSPRHRHGGPHRPLRGRTRPGRDRAGQAARSGRAPRRTVTSGGQATVASVPGRESGRTGWKVRWRARAANTTGQPPPRPGRTG